MEQVEQDEHGEHDTIELVLRRDESFPENSRRDVGLDEGVVLTGFCPRVL